MSELHQTMRLLVSRLVHDLKNPLAAVVSNLRYLQSVVGGTDEQEALKESVVSADRLDTMLDDAVDIARLQDESVPTPDLLPLAELESAVRGRLELLIGNRQLEIRLPQVQLKTDERLLARSVANVVEHALRHTPSRGTVRFDGRVDGDGLTLEVTDEGLPFDPNVGPSFLDRQLPVKQDPASGHRSDQGLRLYFAGLAARALGATPEVRNREDGQVGAVFVMRFPEELIS